MLYAFPVLATVIYKQHRNPQLAGYLPSFYAAPELNIHSLWLQGGEGKGKKATPRWSPRWKLSLKEPQISTREAPSNGEKLKTTPENRKTSGNSGDMRGPWLLQFPHVSTKSSKSAKSAKSPVSFQWKCSDLSSKPQVNRGPSSTCQQVNASVIQEIHGSSRIWEIRKIIGKKIADSDSACCTSASLHISNSKIFQIHGLIYQILSHEFEIRTEFCVLSIDHRHLPAWI